MKKDPLNIITSLIFNLNLLEENRTYNINEFKFLRNLEYHWITIKKYLKMISLIQEYSPEIQIIDDSKLKIKKSKIYKNLTEKEKTIIYLFNNQAFDQNSAVFLPDDFEISKISKSIGYLFNKTESNKYYLTKSSLDLYKSIKQSLSDLIFNEKEINQVFFRPVPSIEFETSKLFKSADFIIRIKSLDAVSTSEIPLRLNLIKDTSPRELEEFYIYNRMS